MVVELDDWFLDFGEQQNFKKLKDQHIIDILFFTGKDFKNPGTKEKKRTTV